MQDTLRSLGISNLALVTYISQNKGWSFTMWYLTAKQAVGL